MFDTTICLIASSDCFFDGVVCFIFVGILPKKPQNSHSVTVYDTLHLYCARRETFDSERGTRSFALQKNQ